MTTAEFQREFMSHAETPDPQTPFDSAGEVVRDYVATRERTLEQIRSLGVGLNGAREVRGKLAAAFVRRWMMLRYPAIDLSFTTRPWWVRVERGEDAVVEVAEVSDVKPSTAVDSVTGLVGKVERFFHASTTVAKFALGSDDDDDDENLKAPRVSLGSMIAGRRGATHHRNADVFVSAAVPDGITPAHRQRARDAFAHYHVGIAALYAKGIDLKAEFAKPERYTSRDENAPAITVFWAPLQHALSVTAEPPRPKGDPAIVFSVARQTFLLAFFDTPDEAPIEHLVREFTEGRLA